MAQTNNLTYADYWQKSLLDTDNTNGAFKNKEALLKENQPVPLAEIRLGKLGQGIVDNLFAEEPNGAQTVSLVVRPQVYIARFLHGQLPIAGIPGAVTPVIINSKIDRSGRIFPEHTFLARDLLEPLDRGSFSIGDVFAQDTFLTKNNFSISHQEYSNLKEKSSQEIWFEARWREYADYLSRFLNEVLHKNIFHEFERADYFLIVKKDVISPSIHIRALYSDLLKFRPIVPLFETYASDNIKPPEPCLSENYLFGSRLAHSGNSALANAQRDALNHFIASRHGDIIAVNGPPGTGKTTLLLSVVASTWAQSALVGGNPSVILAASTNNQAVTNILDAFEKNFSSGEGVFSGRWLPDIKSFGCYFPSGKKEAELSSKYQTRSFFDQRENQEYVLKAKKCFIEKAHQAYPDLKDYSLNSIVNSLQKNIAAEANKLKNTEYAWVEMKLADKNLLKELGNFPNDEFDKREKNLNSELSHKILLEELKNSWGSYLAQENIMYGLLSWLPPVKNKRLLLAKQFLKKTTAEDFDFTHSINMEIDQKIADFKNKIEKSMDGFEKAREVFAAAEKAKKLWQAISSSFKTTNKNILLDLAACDNLADTGIRFNVFLLTTHYWEGRWLMAMDDLIGEYKGDLEKEKRRMGRGSLERRWYRRMMLTPCAVSTFFMLPKELLSKRHNEGGFDDDYLYDFADLLIVDEAGQVLPEVAGASFSLAKKALVVGDTQQIEPIWSITKQIDLGNMVKSSILPANYSEDAYCQLADLGKMSSSGSVMRIAQHATRYQYEPSLARGMFLFDHYRCFDEIVSFCNQLCYGGKLNAKRGPSKNKDNNFLPPMGYLHINGLCESVKGSRHNKLEAAIIADWLSEHKVELEQSYQKSLCQIVGVVSPFGGQVVAIKKACEAKGIKVGSDNNQMTVGTVHALQGAERAIIIFSPTYSKHADGVFIDNNKSMLNVAVSRAKDNFLVFGDMDIFDETQTGKPRGLLASYLFKDKINELIFRPLPREDLKITTLYQSLMDFKAHDLFLLKILNESKKYVVIMTPWLLPSKISREALIAMDCAVKRGVEIIVYTDINFNKDKKDKMLEAIALLKTVGVKALAVQRLHSKAVLCDDHILINGSFNWFSANRAEINKNYETSSVNIGDGVLNDCIIIKKYMSEKIAPGQSDNSNT